MDVVFDLENGSYKPYTKPNNIPQYVHKLSNHPPSVLRNIPKNVNKRLSSISSSEEIFNECAELVGLFILDDISKIDKLEAGLYRDDGLGVTSATPRQTENIKKKIAQIFQKYGLGTTAEANVKVVDFLDVVFDLENGSYKPYTKPNNIPQYVHKLSNHPPSVLRNIPKNVNKRLSSISSSEEIFNAAAPPYQEAIRKSGYDYKLQYEPNPLRQPADKKKRKRKILWFNPPTITQ